MTMHQQYASIAEWAIFRNQADMLEICFDKVKDLKDYPAISGRLLFSKLKKTVQGYPIDVRNTEIWNEFQTVHQRFKDAPDVLTNEWTDLHEEIIFQMGRTILRSNLRLPPLTDTDVGNGKLSIPAIFSYEHYRDAIQSLFRMTNTAASSRNLIDIKTQSGKISLEKISGILKASSTSDFKKRVIDKILAIETKILKVPSIELVFLDQSGILLLGDEASSSAVVTCHEHPQPPVWSEQDRRESGPYSGLKRRRSSEGVFSSSSHHLASIASMKKEREEEKENRASSKNSPSPVLHPTRRRSPRLRVEDDDEEGEGGLEDERINARTELPKRLREATKPTTFPEKLENPEEFDSDFDGGDQNTAAAKARGRRIFETGLRRPKNKWTPLEEDALIEAYSAYGTQWASIKEDSRYKELFLRRTNVDLKDKHRLLVKKGKI